LNLYLQYCEKLHVNQTPKGYFQ